LLLVSGRRFDDEQGAVRGAIVAMRDVTEIKRAERELLQAKERAERASQAKSQFLSLVSHELRTPLTAVIGFASVLRKNRRGALEAEELAYLDRISTNGAALLRLVNDLLDLTSMETEAPEVVMVPVSLQQAIPEVLAEFQERARAGSLALRSHIDERIHPILADPSRLRSLLTRLVDNALKFTSAGSIDVRVVADADGQTARRIEVADTGVGLEAGLLDVLFTPFEQGAPFTIRRHGGVGLGLHLARRYCELMGFSLSVRSTPGVGSTFSIELRPAS
jgi:signal transduction histidine kinase